MILWFLFQRILAVGMTLALFFVWLTMLSLGSWQHVLSEPIRDHGVREFLNWCNCFRNHNNQMIKSWCKRFFTCLNPGPSHTNFWPGSNDGRRHYHQGHSNCKPASKYSPSYDSTKYQEDWPAYSRFGEKRSSANFTFSPCTTNWLQNHPGWVFPTWKSGLRLSI